MREHSRTAKTLLAQLGMTSSAELFALAEPADETGGAVAAAYLANAAAMAITRIDDAERLADQHLARLGEHVEEQKKRVADGWRRDASWMAQATQRYAEQLAALEKAVDAFDAAAYPLRALRGHGLDPITTAP